MLKRRIWLFFVVVGLSALAWGQSVFDMPRLFPQHRMYLAQFIQAAQRGDLLRAEVAARSAAKLFPDDANWAYNVACICAKDNRPEEALDWLEKSIELGFHNVQQLQADADLSSLHQEERFKGFVSRLESLKSAPQQMDALREAGWSAVVMGSEAEVSESNTQWNWDPVAGGYMMTKVALRAGETLPAYAGPYAELIAPWIAEGSAAGNCGELYVNRDEDRTPVRYDAFPGLTPVLYSEAAVGKSAHLGAANGLFIGVASAVPTVGNSVLPILKMPYWRSVPRMFSTESTMNAIAFRLAMSNQLYVYDVTMDYNHRFKGDVLIGNTPQHIATTDLIAQQPNAADAQTQVTELVLAALAAMPKETKEEMYRRNLLVPTMQRLFRQHLKGVKDYFAPEAHPVVFDPTMLDGVAIVRAAHALKPTDLPPFFQLVARQETMPRQFVDYFDLFPSEGLSDTPMCITRVIRGMTETRKITIEAALPTEPGLTFKWFVVNGAPEKITLTPVMKDGSLMTLEVKYHAPFTNRAGMLTRRVDIACIAVRQDGTASAPAFVSFRSLGNEQRTYADGRIAKVVYTQAPEQYVYEDPLLSAAKNWTDSYHYDAQGNCTGWTRVLADGTTHDFDTQGRRIVERAADGTPSKVVKVSYQSIYVPNSNGINAPATELRYADAGEPFSVTP